MNIESIDHEIADAQARLTDAQLALSTANAELLQRPRDEAMRRINGARAAVQSIEAELQALRATRADALQALASAERAEQRNQAREAAAALLKRADEREQLAAAVDAAAEAFASALRRYEAHCAALADEAMAVAKLAVPVQEQRQARLPIITATARSGHAVVPLAHHLLQLPAEMRANTFGVHAGFGFVHGKRYTFADAAAVANRDLCRHLQSALLDPLAAEEAAINAAGVR